MATHELPIYGNYHAYHTKRSTSTTSIDPRLSLLPSELFRGKRVLDIGCNEGWLTVDIAQRFGPSKIIGVDLDGNLIRAAWKRRRSIWSLQGSPLQSKAERDVSLPPSEPEHSTDPKRHKKRKRMDSQAIIPDDATGNSASVDVNALAYFPLSMEHMFGPIPIPLASVPTSNSPATFPHNITFYTADWSKGHVGSLKETQEEGPIGGIEKEDQEGYDIVLAFSITKWIHLNEGDAGLVAFLRKIYLVLRSGGLLFLEPQDWEGYAKARKMTPTLAENYKGLQLRPSDFPRLLKEIGFVEASALATSGEAGYKRSILAFRKL